MDLHGHANPYTVTACKMSPRQLRVLGTHRLMEAHACSF